MVVSLTVKFDMTGFSVSIILSKYNEHLSEPKKLKPICEMHPFG